MTWTETSNDPHGWQQFWKLWSSDRWEVATHDLLRLVLQPGDLFLDIGAWIGPVTRWAIELGAYVIAVEPDPVAFEGLLDATEGSWSHLETWNGALTVDGGSVTLAPNSKPEGAFGDSMSRIAYPDEDGLLVPSWKLDAILGDRVPKMMKMDVEGYEVALAPAVMPWLVEHNVGVQISCHGELLDPALFADYREVRWPEHSWGDIVALP